MAVYTFRLELPNHEVLRFYQGRVRTVQVRSDGGSLLEFDVEHVLGFATRAGISGHFVLFTDATGRFAGIERT